MNLENDMKLTLLAMITFVQLATCLAAPAEAQATEPLMIAQADLGGTRGITDVQAGDNDKKLDINVTVGDPMPMHSRMWYGQPIWIALFVVAGIVLLILLAMAFRGNASSGGTIVKG